MIIKIIDMYNYTKEKLNGDEIRWDKEYAIMSLYYIIIIYV